MYQGKYSGMVIDGYWTVVDYNGRNGLILENMYNHTQVKLTYRQLDKVIAHEDTIARIISRRLTTGAYDVDNRVKRSYGKQKQHYNTRR